MENEIEIIELPSSHRVKLSQIVVAEYFSDFSETTLLLFDDCISSGVYFPRIVRWFSLLTTLFMGHSEWYYLLLGNVLPGIFATIIWYLFRLYRIPILCMVSSILGNEIMKFYMHYFPLAIFCVFILHSWKLFLVCIFSSLIARGVCAAVRALMATVKYNDAVALYVSKG